MNYLKFILCVCPSYQACAIHTDRDKGSTYAFADPIDFNAKSGNSTQQTYDKKRPLEKSNK